MKKDIELYKELKKITENCMDIDLALENKDLDLEAVTALARQEMAFFAGEAVVNELHSIRLKECLASIIIKNCALQLQQRISDKCKLGILENYEKAIVVLKEFVSPEKADDVMSARWRFFFRNFLLM